MTPEQGFGMLAIGMAVIFTIAFIVYWAIKKQERDKKVEQEKKEREKIYGSN
jgi:phosphotransferase system  glucose/maltose/N-acetylglucosamine-specific IIC component